MRIGLTGGNGFVGSHLVRALIKEGIRPRLLLRKSSSLKFLAGLDLDIVHGDFGSGEGFEDFVRGCDVLVHMAAQTVAPNRKAYLEANTLPTIRLLETGRRIEPRLKRFIYISSQEAVGPPGGDVASNETFEAEPITDYGFSKREAERYLLKQAEDLPFKVIIVRPGPVYGPRDKDIFLIFAAVGKGIEPRFLYHSRISAIYVGNLVYFLMKMIGDQKRHSGVFYVSDPRPLTYRKVTRLIKEHWGKTTFPLPVGRPLLWLLSRLSEALASLAGGRSILNRQKYRVMVQGNLKTDPSRAFEAFGHPPYTTAQGIRQAADWYQEEGWV